MIPVIAIGAATALGAMWWLFVRAPVSNAVPDEEREDRRVNETPVQRLTRISKSPR